MFLLFLEATVDTLRDFRATIFENVNTSRLLLHFLGVTVRGRGRLEAYLSTLWRHRVFRCSETHHVFAISGGNPGHLP